MSPLNIFIIFYFIIYLLNKANYNFTFLLIQIRVKNLNSSNTKPYLMFNSK